MTSTSPATTSSKVTAASTTSASCATAASTPRTRALSAQPIFGGPAYYIRNVVYNTPVALKFSNPAGVMVYHNTIVAEDSTNQQVSNAHFANNLFLGTDRQTGIASLGGPTTYSTYDYDGFRPNKGVEQNYTWIGAKPPAPC